MHNKRYLISTLYLLKAYKKYYQIIVIEFESTGTCTDILFSSNHNIHKSSYGLCFWASDPLIERFQQNLSIKGSEAQKQRPYELL